MTCQNCGNPSQQNYCPNCGEKAFDPHSLTIKHFIEETFEGLIHFDNKFFRSLKVLLSKPGRLSLDYVEGRRIRYMKPVQFFLVVNLLFFILAPTNPFSQPLDTYLSFDNYKVFHTNEMLEAKLKSESLSRKEFEYAFDEKISAESKEFVFLFIPFFAILFALIFAAKRLPVTYHLVFSTHFVAFIALWFLITAYLIQIPYTYFIHKGYSRWLDNAVSLLDVVVIFSWLSIGMRKFYKAKWWYNVPVCVILGLFFWFFVQYYRVLLFFKIIHWG